MEQRGLGTRSVHPPRPPAQEGDPVAPVLDPSSTYSFEGTSAFAKASAEKVGAGYVYTRWANPTVDAFESAVAELESATGAEAFSSGMAAISTTILALCSAGDRVVAAKQLYGGTYSLLAHQLPRFGIETTFLSVHDHDSIAKELEGASILYCETIGNPRIEVADLSTLAKLAEAAGVPLIVDNTFASPILCRPIEIGATATIHSATKFLGGHHDLIGGIVVANPPLLERIQDLARDLGGTMSPFNAWLALRGVATLHLRVARSNETAGRIAQRLTEHSEIEQVFYPGLADDPGYELTNQLLGGLAGGTLGFDVKGGRERAGRFQDALRLIKPAASLGGTHSLIVHPASVTHTQLNSDELAAAGIPEGFCRLSVGLEDYADLSADLEQGLDSST
jgi:cystathionine beta-lyase/cystathionine gamma-synthase